ncbi:alanine--glyoxylate aminotransferase family protein [Vibrio cyclitrophicus]|uniref:pyridoxal-phosphate-dependent aminotransferase family protein n=1 Tax=Vibrio cyclitrophicus TaxID=47951 RepID=UPI0002F6A45B|nr:alanine--glyoxylate aminotransferase family protein [Vibrio cyclitrophicus]KAA8599909.1 Serine--pyruvate aminotransferase [Vibrio cyclitrophicus]MBU2933574.1 alanine--glyoxylate aminotransferase family protein [Vibrio cyclitrophicus]MCC4775569.1 alanine--glyoxylate aminotransferase family protein [Vibrio cyclitrophicus]MCC4842592.1 alanine--glyoxylate aminotransferase family protein [Vibrio cyclitrophicus]NOH20821.1 alanine--glyoxylate aminotransferase family protein [Vibrio cyclitrophicus]
MSNLTLTTAIDSFYPPHRTLMGPGPSDISPQVLQALSRPTIGHLDPLFIAMMDELKQLLKYAFQTENEFTIAVSAPGSAGMETCFVNLIEPGEKVIVCRNGVFGERMRENVVRCGGEAILVDDEWGKPVSVEKVEQALAENPDAVAVAFVHAETSTGALSDAQAISAIARQFGALTIVDAVTSLGGVPLLVDEWLLDAVYSGSQKCLSCVPGLSPVTFSQRAVDKMKARQAPVQSWFLDQSLVLGYWSGEGKRSYHHTAPVNSLYALHESLVLLKNEGLDNAWSRHYAMHQELKAGVEALGLKFVVDEESRLPQLNALYFPEGIDEAKVRTQLLEEYNLEIGAGLGSLAGKAWRIGLMGYGARKENVALCLKALKDVLE